MAQLPTGEGARALDARNQAQLLCLTSQILEFSDENSGSDAAPQLFTQGGLVDVTLVLLLLETQFEAQPINSPTPLGLRTSEQRPPKSLVPTPPTELAAVTSAAKRLGFGESIMLRAAPIVLA